MTKTDRIIRYLRASGFVEEMSTSKKYRKFTFNNRTYWVGKAGAVRTGRTCFESVSITDAIESRMKLWESKA